MRIVIVSFTQAGGRKNQWLVEELSKLGHKVTGYTYCKYEMLGLVPFQKMDQVIKQEFLSAACMIFIGACGIAVRGITPYVSDKKKDPAVLVVDEQANYVIPILSGHVGGANEMAQQIAIILKAIPVITTATDINDKFAVDVWAKKKELIISDWNKAKEVSAAIVNGDKVGFACDKEIEVMCPNGLVETEEAIGVCVSYDETKQPFETTLVVVPRNLVLGIGCRKGKTKEELEAFITEVLHNQRLSKKSIQRIASIDLKKEEQGLVALANEWKVEFITYTSEELKQVEGEFACSPFVAKTTGVGNVCERSAVLASNNGALRVQKYAKDGMTIAISKRRIR